MELHLQFGFGMMDHCKSLLSAWGGGTAILSPRDLTHGQLVKLGSEIQAIPQAKALLDPQFYLPHSDHKKLSKHSYWPNDYETAVFWQGPALRHLLVVLRTLNAAVGCNEFLLPGLFAAVVDDDWCRTQQMVLDEARFLGCDPLICTIALGADAVRDAAQIATVLESAEEWKAPAYYVVCEHPRGEYLVTDPNWVANVLDLAAGLKLAGAKVILGYCTHQMLVASVAKVDAIASGTWMNVRSFPPHKFNFSNEEEVRQRATWYYCPQALSEYKIPFLDIAWRLGILQLMAPHSALDGGYVTTLFSGAQPSTVGFGQQPAFRHYLHALHEQVRLMRQESFDDACLAYAAVLADAEALLARLRGSNINGNLRDFSEIIDVNRAALGLFSALRAPILRRAWASI